MSPLGNYGYQLLVRGELHRSGTVAGSSINGGVPPPSGTKAGPGYPDLRGNVASLEANLAAAKKALAEKPAAPAYPDLSGRVTELEAALVVAKAAKPAYPDLSGEVASLQKKSAALEASLTTSQSRASELQTQLDACKRVAVASVPCDKAVAVGSTYDQCINETKAMACSTWDVDTTQLGTIQPPASCRGVIKVTQ